ncbi:MAG: nucleotidyltransferase domain-containing protein [Solobacterium sp.]|nr:nucleotidyltransferase domain-containing protein [Solobacterium sp.]
MFCFSLFRSYAHNTAHKGSNLDLLIIGDVNGLRFYELTERLRQSLHKRVDLLDVKQLLNNEALLKEVLKTGIRIYE